jgi:hypothetical protein
VALQYLNADEYNTRGDIVVNFFRIWLYASETVDVMADCSVILLQGKCIVSIPGISGLFEAFVERAECNYGTANPRFCKDGLKNRSVPEVEFGEAGYLLTRPLLEELKCAPLFGGLENTRDRINTFGHFLTTG